MNDFKDLDIAPPATILRGKRIEIEDILGTEIIVSYFSIELSQFPKKPGDQCMYMQIKTEGKERVILTIGKTLIATMAKVDINKLPFKTKIIKIDKRYEFS